MVLNSCWHPTSLALQADRVGVGANQREAVRGFAYLTAWATKAIRCLFGPCRKLTVCHFKNKLVNWGNALRECEPPLFGGLTVASC